MPAKFTIQPTELGLSLNRLRNGPVADPTRHAIDSIALGSTTRPFPGTTMTLNITNLQPVTLSTIAPLLTGLRYTHVCGAPGVGNSCFLPHKVSPSGTNASNTKPPFVLRKNASQPPINLATHRLPAEAKRDSLWTIWNISAYSIKLKPSCRISRSLMFPRYLCSRAYLLHSKNNSLAGLSTPSIRTVMNFTKLANQRILPPIRAIPSQLLRPRLTTLPLLILSAEAPVFHFPYPIQDLCR